MGRKKTVSIGHLEFPTQKDALAYFREILNRYTPGNILAGADFKDVEALLFNHPRSLAKVGAGIKSIVVDIAKHKGQCFHVIRLGDTRDNFSYTKCISGDPSPFTSFSRACRRSVEDELNKFKADYFQKHQNTEKQVKCPETKEWISFNEAHVDHSAPLTFSVIVKSFKEKENIDLNLVSYVKEGLYGHELADDTLKERFREWHKKMLKLRVIKNTRNLAKAFMGRITPTKADHKL